MGVGAQMIKNIIAKAENEPTKPLKEEEKERNSFVQSVGVGGQMVLKMIEAYEKNMNK